MPDVRRLIVLGSTGSIGRQTLDVVEHVNALHARGASSVRLEVVGLAAGRGVDAALDQAARLGCKDVAIGAESSLAFRAGEVRVRAGSGAARRLVSEVECDLVVAAISGFAGLDATLAGVERGRDVALANKESLVAGGSLLVREARRRGARLLPVDSEHAGLWRCLIGAAGDPAAARAPHADLPLVEPPAGVTRVILTASGGPFREWSREAIARATVEQALAHPVWRMGRKNTIDSATLANKALEIIEARWLFGLGATMIDAVIHPESIVHAIVEGDDGSMLAHLARPDMRGPIQAALTHPHTIASSIARVDLARLATLRFETPDLDRFPMLALGREVIERGGNAGSVFSSANEACVERFLGSSLAFPRIHDLTRAAVDALAGREVETLEDVVRADAEARAFVESRAP